MHLQVFYQKFGMIFNLKICSGDIKLYMLFSVHINYVFYSKKEVEHMWE